VGDLGVTRLVQAVTCLIREYGQELVRYLPVGLVRRGLFPAGRGQGPSTLRGETVYGM